MNFTKTILNGLKVWINSNFLPPINHLIEKKAENVDWNENDPSASGYIANRPFYTGDPVENVLVEEASFSGTEADVPGTIYPVIEGQEYTVILDGTEYTTTGYLGYYSNCALGNYTLNGINQGDDVPFLILSSSDGGDTAHVKTTSDGDHTIKVFIREIPIHKIDEKYLPDLPEPVYTKAVTTEGDGAAYTATVDGITALEAGITFMMIPHTTSTSKTATLNVNGLGAKMLRRPLSANNSTTVANTTDNWLYASKPVEVMYNGTYWIVTSMPRTNGPDIYGTIAGTSVGYDNTTSGMTATTVQAAIDELYALIAQLNG